VPPLASAQIIDLEAARRALASDAAPESAATFGAVPLSFRQTHEAIQGQSPRLHRSAWAAAAAAHVLIGAAILLYASLARLPEPPPGIAVTLSFESSKSTAEPGPAPTVETPPTETPTTETPPVEASPTVPEPAVEAAPEASAKIAPTPEPVPEPTPVDIPPPLPEPPLATAPEIPQPVAVAPPPPPPPVPAPPRPKARPHAPPAKHQAPSPPQAAAPGLSDNPPAVSLSTGIAPMAEPPITAPIIPPSPAGTAAGNPKPDYPIAGRRFNLEGRLVLRVDVTVSGSASAVAVVVSSGHPVLDQAALEAVQTWQFNPATKGGVPVASVIYWPVEFRLLGGE
jgi:protein TonB